MVTKFPVSDAMLLKTFERLPSTYTSKMISLIFEPLEKYLNFNNKLEIYGTYVDDQYIVMEEIYEKLSTVDSSDYSVTRIKFKDKVVGYMISQGERLTEEDIIISNTSEFKKMLDYVQSYYIKPKDCKFDNEDKIEKLDPMFLEFVENNNG